MLTTPGPEPVRETQKVFLIYRVQHFHHRTLDDLVFQRGNPQRALFAVRLRYVLSPNRQCPVRSALYLRVQALEILFQSRLVVPPRQASSTPGAALRLSAKNAPRSRSAVT